MEKFEFLVSKKIKGSNRMEPNKLSTDCNLNNSKYLNVLGWKQ